MHRDRGHRAQQQGDRITAPAAGGTTVPYQECAYVPKHMPPPPWFLLISFKPSTNQLYGVDPVPVPIFQSTNRKEICPELPGSSVVQRELKARPPVSPYITSLPFITSPTTHPPMTPNSQPLPPEGPRGLGWLHHAHPNLSCNSCLRAVHFPFPTRQPVPQRAGNVTALHSRHSNVRHSLLAQ